MGNSIYDSMQKNNPYEAIAGRVREFSKTIQGDPRQMVEQLLSSGQMSQQEFNRYAQMAQQIAPFMK